jgi:hypothetical protein
MATSAEARPETAGVNVAKEAVVKALPLDPIRTEIDRLRREQLQIRQDKKKLTSQIRNAQRRAQRLRGRARQLSDEDLVAVLMMRKNDAQVRGAAKSSSSSSETAGGGSGGPNGESPAPHPVAREERASSPASATNVGVLEEDGRRTDMDED